ncbi:vacuolar protein sorting-associated protein VTA1 homolog [Notolabrus celidotus]|uniref:vacuolar protein sorting-associated protein VTA1 homolog n=1 Tax=Notolabrus celidotus TaxID=1203425 RepID=UPI00148F91FA|nr:vacuolar protein sorting-associated protein VTA1 homolog [Notolabrus celidotus]
MALPPQLKAIQHHMRTAQEHESRDPVVAYYCRLYAMQTGMKLDSKTPECRKFLIKLMDQLETYELLKIRGCLTYFSTILYNSPTLFQLPQNIQHRKYARWKATYIHNCLKSGETPQSGPIGMEDEEADGYGAEGFSAQGFSHGGSFRGGPPSDTYESIDQNLGPGSSPGIGFTPGPGSGAAGPPNTNFNNIHIPPGAHAPANTPAELPPPTEPVKPVPVPRSLPSVDPSLLNAQQQGGVHLSPEDFTKAQKFCKYAGSALQYEDVNTAIQNLQKALKLLTTGKE